MEGLGECNVFICVYCFYCVECFVEVVDVLVMIVDQYDCCMVLGYDQVECDWVGVLGFVQEDDVVVQLGFLLGL